MSIERVHKLDEDGRSVGLVETRTINYTPLPSPSRFHALCADPKNLMVGFSGPVGSGKTMSLCQEIISLAYQNPGRMGMIGAPTFSVLYSSTLATLWEILNNEGIPYTHRQGHQGPHPSIYLHEPDVWIFLRHLDAFERLRGPNLAWAAVDELTYALPGSLTRLEARVRGSDVPNPKFIAAWTPCGFDWVYDRFIRDAEVRDKWYVGTAEGIDVYGSACYTPANRHWVVRGCPFENTFVGEDYYHRLKRSYDQQLFLQEVLGQYVSMGSGQVYYCFDRHAHVQEHVRYEPKLPLLWSMDFNVDPMCAVLCQRDYDGPSRPLRVVDEIRLSSSSTPKMLEEFVRRYPEHEAPIVIYGDATGAFRGSATGSSDFAVVREFFKSSPLITEEQRQKWQVKYRVADSNPHVPFRLNAVNALLRSAAGEIGLQLSPKCKHLIRDFEKVQYKEGSSDIDKTKDKTISHLSDAIGYLIAHDYPVTNVYKGGSSKPLVF